MRIPQMAVAVNHHHGFKPFVGTQRCKLGSFTQLDSGLFQLIPTKLAHRSLSTPCLTLTNKVEDEAHDIGPRVEIVGGRGAPGIRALVVEAAIAMASGVDPIPAPSGLGGAYYLRNRNGNNIAVAKPIDEEPLAMNNPKGYTGRTLGQPGLKCSVRVGETGVREVAAYLLDHNGFAGVPPTALVKISHVAFHVNHSAGKAAPVLPKIASLQRFVDHDLDAGDLGPSGFSVSSVHRIGILDIRLLNLDRHAGNILVKKHKHENNGVYNGYVSESYVVGVAELVPIDHGLCLPELLDDPYFEWLHWPQASVPFSESEVEYICRLDPLKDAELLRTELPSLRESSIRVLVLCTIFLKCAVNAGLCLADIGDMMTREFCGTEQGPSVLETLCTKVKVSMNNIFEDDQSEEENEEETDMFELDIESENSSCADVLDLPRLLQSRSGMSKPPKIPIKFLSSQSMSEFPHKILFPLRKENDNDDDHEHNKEAGYDENGNSDEDGGENHKLGGLTKSVSFSVTKYNNETGGISFRSMTEEEWGLFIESFEKLLPKAFESRKSMGLKQRLGTSCKF